MKRSPFQLLTVVSLLGVATSGLVSAVALVFMNHWNGAAEDRSYLATIARDKEAKARGRDASFSWSPPERPTGIFTLLQSVAPAPPISSPPPNVPPDQYQTWFKEQLEKREQDRKSEQAARERQDLLAMQAYEVAQQDYAAINKAASHDEAEFLRLENNATTAKSVAYIGGGVGLGLLLLGLCPIGYRHLVRPALVKSVRATRVIGMAVAAEAREIEREANAGSRSESDTERNTHDEKNSN